MGKTWQEHNEAFAAGGRRAIAEMQAEHDALAGPTILDMRKHGESWNAIAGYLDLSGVPSPSQHRGLGAMSNWTGRAVRRIHGRLAPDPRQAGPFEGTGLAHVSALRLAGELTRRLEDAGIEDLATAAEAILVELGRRHDTERSEIAA